MPFASAFSSPQQTLLRGAEYRSTQSVAYCPSVVAFQAQPSAAITSSVFAQIAYNNVTVGAYTDIWVGMKVLICATADPRTPLFIGRVRKAPTSGILYINEAAVVIQTSYTIFVLWDFDLEQRLPRLVGSTELVDWDVVYTRPAPLIAGLQSTYINPVASGMASFSLSATAWAVASGATITAWLWDVRDGTITTGSSTTAAIVVSFPQGHRWIKVTATNSLGVSSFMVIEVYVGTQYILSNLEDVSIEADIDNGYSASITAFHSDEVTNVFRTLLDNSRVTLFSTEVFADGSTTPIVGNVDMVGRLRNENSATDGDAEVVNLQTTTFEIEGFAAQYAQLSSPQLFLSTSAVPSVWGQILSLTPARAIAHIVNWYSTVSTLTSISILDLDLYLLKDLNVESTSAGEAITTLARYVTSRVNHAPSGEISIQLDAFYSDSGVVDIVSILTSDMLAFDIERDYKPRVGQVQVGAERYTTTGNVSKYFLGSAPPQAQGNGEEVAQLDGLLLKSNQTNAQSITELNAIVGAFFAISQPAENVSVSLFDSWRNVLIPTCYQYYTFTIDDLENNRGIEYTTSVKWQLQKVSISPNIETGEREVTATFRRKPVAVGAQVLSVLLPDATNAWLPVLPPLDPYGAFPSDPLINYPSDAPEDDDQQPVDGNSAANGYSQLPSDQVKPKPKPGCKMSMVNLQNSSEIFTPYTLTNSKNYTLTARGFGQIGAASPTWSQTFNFRTSNGGFSAISSKGAYTAGIGWQTTYGDDDTGAPGTDVSNRLFLEISFSATTITSAQLLYSAVQGINDSPSEARFVDIYINNTPGSGRGEISEGLGTVTDQTLAGSVSLTVSKVGLSLRAGIDTVAPLNNPGGSGTLKQLILTGTGVNPFSGITTYDVTNADSFYTWTDTTAPVSNPLVGLRVDAATPAAQAYSPSHVYEIAYVGDGSSLGLKFADTDYSDNANSFLYVQVCATDNSGVP